MAAAGAGSTDRLAAQAGATARAVAGVGAAGAAPARGSSTASAPPAQAPAFRPAPSPTPSPAPALAAPAAGAAPTATVRPAALPAAPGTPTPTPAIAFPKGRPITYVAIGASDSVGVGAPIPAVDGWVPQLHRKLPAGSKLVNLGISGARLGQAVEKELPKALDARPDFVTVWNVVNDLNADVDLAAFERDLDRLLGDLTTRTPARVAIGNCPDLARVPAYLNAGIPPDALRQEVGRWNATIARAAGRHPGRVYVVDLYARSAEIDVDPSLVAGDDFHPSSKGYARIAEVFWDFLVANRLFAA